MTKWIVDLFNALPAWVTAFNGLNVTQTFIIALSSLLLFIVIFCWLRPSWLSAIFSLVFILVYIGACAWVVPSFSAQIARAPTEPLPTPPTQSSSAKWADVRAGADWVGMDVACSRSEKQPDTSIKPDPKQCTPQTLGMVANCWAYRTEGYPFDECKGAKSWCTYKDQSKVTVTTIQARGTNTGRIFVCVDD
jgi:hypothetical protein